MDGRERRLHLLGSRRHWKGDLTKQVEDVGEGLGSERSFERMLDIARAFTYTGMVLISCRGYNMGERCLDVQKITIGIGMDGV